MTVYQADGREPRALLKETCLYFILFLWSWHIIQPESVQLWQEDQLGELCLLGCFSTRANSAVSYLGHFYLSKHPEVHY